MVPHRYIQQAVNDAIARPDFEAALPPLSDDAWAKILKNHRGAFQENERLEFMGDALMYATIGRQLYAQIPDGTPHMYTCLRAALHSNATFSLLARKLDIMGVERSVLTALTARTFGDGECVLRNSRPQIKATADLFETVIGAYYLESGFEALSEWVAGIYAPLIQATRTTFLHSSRRDLRPPSPPAARILPKVQKRLRTPSPLKPAHPFKCRAYVIDKIKDAYKKRVQSPIPSLNRVRSPTAVVSRNSFNAPYLKASKEKPMPIFIDLTLDDGPRDDDKPDVTTLSHPSVGAWRRPLPRTPKISPLPPKAHTVIHVLDDDDDSSAEEESVLGQVLLSESTSDMDLGSSDEGADAFSPPASVISQAQSSHLVSQRSSLRALRVY